MEVIVFIVIVYQILSSFILAYEFNKMLGNKSLQLFFILETIGKQRFCKNFCKCGLGLRDIKVFSITFKKTLVLISI